jgi:hypothetical protein
LIGLWAVLTGLLQIVASLPATSGVKLFGH